ncbi:4-alpha-glucanotransferase [Cetobacterium somerae]|uniref:4-alpha-glucanotransferase n=1 Tax=Cetobacterium somerae TaxID=188913 RepID=UPI00211F31C3|nr:4-alpha-glucanotransferase [Cetobacterium somerae]MCQ9626747.1 4-alpha-glucanotransferase [Cetobacterium somerae]
MKDRSSGILLHITSLPGDYGIGDFGKCAYEFVDFLEKSHQKYWQILPMGITGYGDSPYQSFSAFAGNPYFIDLNSLIELDILTKEDLKSLSELNTISNIQYDKLYIDRYKVLKKAFLNFKNKNLLYTLNNFKNKNIWWLENYALYMAIKDKFNDKSWLEWPRDYKFRDKKTLKKAKLELQDEINFHIFLQYLFDKQWNELKSYANNKGIKIIGDIPIFIATDSADTWENPNMFCFDKKLQPTKVAGCPPDAFSADGQFWGNVLYNWKYIEKNNFKWWIKRIKSCFKLYDTVRIDHFRGFESFWSIPAKAKTARFGKWEKGPGMKLFNAIKNSLGNLDIIAEDLGFLTPKVYKLLKDSGFPGMKILEFAFDSREESDYLPHKYPKKSIAYTGTHDNQTLVGWYETINKKDKIFCDDYLDNFLKDKNIQDNSINWKFIEALWSSNSQLVVAPMQDFLGLDDSSRMNTPSTLGNNWIWRVDKSFLDSNLSQKISILTKKYNR